MQKVSKPDADSMFSQLVEADVHFRKIVNTLLPDSVLVFGIPTNATTCPSCASKLIPADFEKRRCMTCHQYLIVGGETLTELVMQREAAKIYTHDLKGTTSKPIIFVNTTTNMLRILPPVKP